MIVLKILERKRKKKKIVSIDNIRQYLSKLYVLIRTRTTAKVRMNMRV